MYLFCIDKDGSQPIYLQIRDQLLALILQEQLLPGQKIPSARALSEQMKVSRVTVAQALRELIREGRLFTVAGKGTFISPEIKIEPNLQKVWGFSETFRTLGYTVTSQLILLDTIHADTASAQALQISEKTQLIRLKRKRLLDEQPVGVEIAHLVKDEFPDFERIDWNNQSLYSALREHYGINLVCGTNYIEAAYADEETAKHLSIPKNTAVLATERIACIQSQRPVEFVRAFYRSDRVRFMVDMTSEHSLKLLTSVRQ